MAPAVNYKCSTIRQPYTTNLIKPCSTKCPPAGKIFVHVKTRLAFHSILAEFVSKIKKKKKLTSQSCSGTNSIKDEQSPSCVAFGKGFLNPVSRSVPLNLLMTFGIFLIDLFHNVGSWEGINGGYVMPKQ